MTFKEEFSALEQKSLNQIIATKIHKELSELRARVDASPTIPKRWVWELIQNAKDVNIGGNSSATIGLFTTAGTFKLYCTVHAGMNLTVVVQ